MGNALWGVAQGIRVAIFFVLLSTVGKTFGGSKLFDYRSPYHAVVVAELAGGILGGPSTARHSRAKIELV